MATMLPLPASANIAGSTPARIASTPITSSTFATQTNRLRDARGRRRPHRPARQARGQRQDGHHQHDLSRSAPGGIANGRTKKRPRISTEAGTVTMDISPVITMSPSAYGLVPAGLLLPSRQDRRNRRDGQRDQRDFDRGRKRKRPGQHDRDDRHDHEHRHERTAEQRRPPHDVQHVARRRPQAEPEDRHQDAGLQRQHDRLLHCHAFDTQSCEADSRSFSRK